jgi:hypothetical protein
VIVTTVVADTVVVAIANVVVNCAAGTVDVAGTDAIAG